MTGSDHVLSQSLSAALHLPGLHPGRRCLRLAVSSLLTFELTHRVRLVTLTQEGNVGHAGGFAVPGSASQAMLRSQQPREPWVGLWGTSERRRKQRCCDLGRAALQTSCFCPPGVALTSRRVGPSVLMGTCVPVFEC